MTSEAKATTYYVISLLCGVWFLLTGWMWTYLACLFIAYPVGLIGLVLWYQGRKTHPNSILSKISISFLIFGLIASIAAIFLYK